MPVRLKKLIGTVLLVALVIVYAMVATTVAVRRLGNSGPLGSPGLLLRDGNPVGLPAMGIISWMEKTPKNKA